MNGLIVFANDLAKFFILSADKRKAATHIIYELNSRVYAGLYHLNEEDKKFIVQLMEAYMKGNLQLTLKSGEMIVRNEDDYTAFVEMKEYILRHLKVEEGYTYKLFN